MADKTAIEWTDATWNPTTGCTQVSPGCDHCYALTLSERFRGVPGHYFENGFDVQLRPDKLDQPLRWKKPRRIFVNSMSDLFHDDIPELYIASVFDVMAQASQHTFQLLTKRHGRMRSLLRRWIYEDGMVMPPNVWLGVSVENQQWADIRIPALLETPAARRFLSCEPLLGPVDLSRFLHLRPIGADLTEAPLPPSAAEACGLPALHWVIAGGESGRGARPMDLQWARQLRDQSEAAGVAFHFKQWGAHGSDGVRRDKHINGRDLDGRTWDEFPEAVA